MEKSCRLCNKAFSFLHMNKSKCKRCQLTICSDCNKTQCKFAQNFLNPPKVDRICLYCKVDCMFQQELLQQIKPHWNTDSGFQDSVIKNGRKTILKETYKTGIELWNARQNEELIEQIKKDFVNAFICQEYFNYSFQDWISFAQLKCKRERVIEDLVQVIGAFSAKNPTIGYSKDLFMIVVTLLTLMESYVVYYLLDCIYNSMPQEYWPANNLPYDTNVKAQMVEFQQAFKLDPMQLPTVKKFMEYFSIQSIQSMFVKLLNFSCFFSILQDFVKEMNYDEIFRYVKVVAKLNIKTLTKFGLMDANKLQSEIQRQTDHKLMQQVKELLDQNMSQSPLTIYSPRQSMFFDKNNAKQLCYSQSQSVLEIDQMNQSTNSMSQRDYLNQEDEGLIAQFIVDQSQQLRQLQMLIQQRKQDLKDLQFKNSILKMQQQQKAEVQLEYYKGVTQMFDEISKQVGISLEQLKYE